MAKPVSQQERDVTLLMMVRLMPEPDFRSLCDDILHGGPVTCNATHYGPEYCDGVRRAATACDAVRQVCGECGGPVVLEPLVVACAASVGVLACKGCIDEALAGVFGPPDLDLDPATNFLARHVLTLATVGGHRVA
jgi:hypothetical protein